MRPQTELRFPSYKVSVADEMESRKRALVLRVTPSSSFIKTDSKSSRNIAHHIVRTMRSTLSITLLLLLCVALFSAGTINAARHSRMSGMRGARPHRPILSNDVPPGSRSRFSVGRKAQVPAIAAARRRPTRFAPVAARPMKTSSDLSIDWGEPVPFDLSHVNKGSWLSDSAKTGVSLFKTGVWLD